MAELSLNFDLFFYNSSDAASLSVSLIICEVVGLLSMGGTQRIRFSTRL